VTFPGESLSATAPEPSGDTWTFTGTGSDHGKNVAFRMVFARLGSGLYRRDFQRADSANSGAWATYAGETCARGG
jgi:hypothetical protein